MERRAFRVDPRLLDLARSMHHEPAPAEQKLWRCLRNKQLGGFKFRRQHGVDRYVLDFYCAEHRLAIEIDGPSHDARQGYDRDRTAHLLRMRIDVIRFSNTDVHENLNGVLLAILRECEGRHSSASGPSPRPSPPSTGERGRETPRG